MFIDLDYIKDKIQSGQKVHYSDLDKIVQSLQNGHMIIAIPQPIDEASVDYQGTESVLTDGTWFWIEALPYSLSRFNIPLPEEFIQAIRANNYTVEQLSEKELDDCLSLFLDQQSTE